ncbi:MAG: nitroreductase family deazaflavin-dependent oxidoreductase [Anaerolineales bacterium]|jgi:deazaflavin-dependent oxidoreductase (nitroreductase family)
MSGISSDAIRLPKGLLRLGFRLPVWFYRLGLGFLMGKRFIYFEHTGRKSGLLRRTVVEIVRYDKEGEYYVIVSGYGEKADWYKNLMKTPEIKAQVGGRHFDGAAARLPENEALGEFQDYARRYPNALKYLGRLMGLQIEGTEEDLVQLSQVLPVLPIKVV